MAPSTATPTVTPTVTPTTTPAPTATPGIAEADLHEAAFNAFYYGVGVTCIRSLQIAGITDRDEILVNCKALVERALREQWHYFDLEPADDWEGQVQ